jgi:hypothetical protein
MGSRKQMVGKARPPKLARHTWNCLGERAEMTYFFNGYGVPSRWVYPLSSAIMSISG